MMIWRLLASVLVVSDQGQRQRQTIKHEQAMSDSKNKTDTLRFARRANGFMNRDNVLVWLSLAWFVALCGTAIWVLFWPRILFRLTRRGVTSSPRHGA